MLLLLFALLLLAPPALAETAFVERSATGVPFRSVRVWAPPEGISATDAVLLLHGNQGDAPDGSWLANLRYYPEFASQILIAPGLKKGDYQWDRPSTLRALNKLVDDVLKANPSTRLWVLGYSAGASRTMTVAKALHRRPDGLITIAGDTAKALREGRDFASLKRLPILIVCNVGDTSPNGSCAHDRRNEALLRKSGFTHVIRETIPGDHNFHAAELVPVMTSWRAKAL